MYASFTERDWKNVAPNNTFLDGDEWMLKKKKTFHFDHQLKKKNLLNFEHFLIYLI